MHVFCRGRQYDFIKLMLKVTNGPAAAPAPGSAHGPAEKKAFKQLDQRSIVWPDATAAKFEPVFRVYGMFPMIPCMHVLEGGSAQVQRYAGLQKMSLVLDVNASCQLWLGSIEARNDRAMLDQHEIKTCFQCQAFDPGRILPDEDRQEAAEYEQKVYAVKHPLFP